MTMILCGVAYRREVGRVRAEQSPGGAEVVMELDPALKQIRNKCRQRTSQPNGTQQRQMMEGVGVEDTK